MKAANPRSPSAAGLNLHAVFSVDALPRTVTAALPEAATAWRQLHLFAHGGGSFWQALQTSPFVAHADPVDAFSAEVVRRWFDGQGVRHRLLFPFGEGHLPLQGLGELAGWHHTSPFMLGINDRWGSWFAYRAVALADTELPATPRKAWGNPCLSCLDTPCIRACPAGALAGGRLDLDTCVDFRFGRIRPVPIAVRRAWPARWRRSSAMARHSSATTTAAPCGRSKRGVTRRSPFQTVARTACYDERHAYRYLRVRPDCD